MSRRGKMTLMTEEGSDALHAIWKRVEDKLGADCEVIYCAYKFDDKKVPIDNLDEVAFQGKIRIFRRVDPNWCDKDGTDYQSPVLENPTWFDLCGIANEMILTTKEEYHVFLEGITVTGIDGDVTLAEFEMDL